MSGKRNICIAVITAIVFAVLYDSRWNTFFLLFLGAREHTVSHAKSIFLFRYPYLNYVDSNSNNRIKNESWQHLMNFSHKNHEISDEAPYSHFLLHIAKRRTPMLITQSPAVNWTALALWNMSYLPHVWPYLLGATLRTPQPHRYNSDTKATAGPPIVVREELAQGGGLLQQLLPHTLVPDVLTDMPTINFTRQFLDEGAQGRVSAAFGANYRILEGLYGLASHSSWRDFLMSEPVAAQQNISTLLTAPTLTLLGPGSVLQLGYSEYHRYKIQIQGSSRIILVSPEDTVKHMYLYPSIHMSRQQSQVVLEGLTPSGEVHYTGALNSSFHEVILRAGQVLYIPPYWLVQLENPITLPYNSGASAAQVSRTHSLSMDVLSPSLPQLVTLEAFHSPLPYLEGEMTSEVDRLIAAQVYLVHVISRIRFAPSPVRLAKWVYEQRYEVLYPEGSLGMEQHHPRLAASVYGVCSSEDGSVWSRDVSIPVVEERKQQQHTVLQKINMDRLHAHVKHVAECFNDASLQQSVATLRLFDYVEQIARWGVLNSPENTVYFLKYCLNIDRKLQVPAEEVLGESIKIQQDSSDDTSTSGDVLSKKQKQSNAKATSNAKAGNVGKKKTVGNSAI